MDQIEVKKNIEHIMKEVSSKNRLGLFNKVNKKNDSLEDIVERYNNFLNRISELEDVSTWGEPFLEHESYDRANGMLEKIKNDLVKGFSVVPYKFYSLEIDPNDGSLLIKYIAKNEEIRDFRINNFVEKVSKGFKTTDFNIYREPLDFSKIIETIMTDINGYWVKNILDFIKEVKKVNETNEIIDAMNNKAEIKNSMILKKNEYLFEKLDEVKTVFPIKLSNGETLVPIKKDSLNDYVLFDSSGKVLLKIINSNNIDKTLLFEKCKIDEKSIPSWINNDNLFKKFENIEEDYDFMINEFRIFKSKYKSIEPYKSVFKEPIKEVQKEDEKPVNKKEEIKKETTKIDIESIKQKVFDSLEKINGKVSKKLEVPDAILFSYEDGIKIIDKRYLKYLKCLNLSKNNFNNVKVSGVDFSDCNPKLLDPQTIYDKDLSGTKFNSFPFYKDVSFNAVDLSDAIIIIPDDIDIDFSNSFGNVNTFVNVNNKNIEIEIMGKRSKI